MTDHSATCIQALEYIERGWAPIPIPHKKKAPILEGWTKLRITVESAAQYFNSERQNIGVLLGQPSGDLVDVDIDSPEAAIAAHHLLPDTGCVFGRASNPRSHLLFLASCRTHKFADPAGNVLVELRSTGCQTVIPPSVHPSGEQIEWEADNGPAEIEGARLTQIVGLVAAAALIARHWPVHGRHDAALALSGALKRAGWTLPQTTLFIRAVVEAAHDDEAPDRLRAVADTYAKDTPTTGWPRLRELLGRDVVGRVFEWLGVARHIERDQAPVDVYEGGDGQGWTGPIGDAASPELEIPIALIEGAPGVLGAYIGWYLSAARNPEPVYALASGIGFISAAVGMRRHLPDCYLNTGLLTIGPTESGKETISRKLEGALKHVAELGREAVYIQDIEARFSSASAVWWTLHDSKAHAAFLFDTELGRLLAAATTAGTPAYDIIDALLKVHDAVERERVLPIRYSERQKKGVRRMGPLANPFLCVHGTGTPRFYTEARALAGEDGSLNRLLILHCEGRAELRATEPCVPFPEDILKFFQDFAHARVTLAYEAGVEEYRRDRTVAARKRIDTAPGTWGRYGLKASRFALLAAVCRDSHVVTEEDMKWACDVVWEASDSATRRFEAAGGLAHSECDALERAILSAFNAPTVVANGGRLTRRLLYQICRKWKESNFQMRDRALRSLEQAGFIVLDQQRGWSRK